MFAAEGNNKDVVFADINLSEAPIRGEPHNPGRGGWPTIRYFNKETGLKGGNYEQKTDESMCAELGDNHNMIDYVEDYGKTSLCGLSGENCSEKEQSYLAKMKEEGADAQQMQAKRLEGMDFSKPEFKEWALRRSRILKKLTTAGGQAGSDEL